MTKITFLAGAAAGMAIAAAAVTGMYPEVSRRMVRDSRRICRCGRRAVERMFS